MRNGSTVKTVTKSIELSQFITNIDASECHMYMFMSGIYSFTSMLCNASKKQQKEKLLIAVTVTY